MVKALGGDVDASRAGRMLRTLREDKILERIRAGDPWPEGYASEYVYLGGAS